MEHARRIGVATLVVAVIAVLGLGSAPALGAGRAKAPAAPSVSSAKPVTTEVGFEQSVAFDGEDYLVVWSQLTNLPSGSGSLEVYGAQVSGDGTQVQPIGAISTTGDGKTDRAPDVTWNGSRYLVVWEHSFGDSDIDILGRRITKAGFPQGGTLSISTPTGNQTSPSVTASGSTFFTAWSDARTGAGDIYGGRVSDAGVVVDQSPGIRLTTTVRADTDPAVAATPNGYLVTFEFLLSGTNTDIYALPVSTTGQIPVAPVPIATGTDVEENPAVASDGTRYLAVWTDDASGTGTYDLQGQRVQQNGGLLGTTIPISTANAVQKDPDITFNHDYFFVAWRDTRDFWGDIYAALVSTSGTVQTPNGILVNDNEGTGGLNGPAVSAGPDDWGVVYDDALASGPYLRNVAPK